MLENIAIIKEVQDLLPTKQAQVEGVELLDRLKLAYIGNLRVAQCKAEELFYVMFIRAMMTKKNSIVIDMPYAIIYNLQDIEQIIYNIELLNSKKKNIFIFDTLNHKTRYKNYLAS